MFNLKHNDVLILSKTELEDLIKQYGFKPYEKVELTYWNDKGHLLCVYDTGHKGEYLIRFYEKDLFITINF